MTIEDVGPRPQAFNLEQAARENRNYRTVAWSGCYLQVTLMSIAAGRDIGLEMHSETDQFIRLDAGRGHVQIGPAEDRRTFEADVSDGWCVLVPAGSWHNITNTGDEPMQIYTIYAPAHHRPGKIHRTSSEAAADENDAPANWSIQPPTVPGERPS